MRGPFLTMCHRREPEAGSSRNGISLRNHGKRSSKRLFSASEIAVGERQEALDDCDVGFADGRRSQKLSVPSEEGSRLRRTLVEDQALETQDDLGHRRLRVRSRVLVEDGQGSVESAFPEQGVRLEAREYAAWSGIGTSRMEPDERSTSPDLARDECTVHLPNPGVTLRPDPQDATERCEAHAHEEDDDVRRGIEAQVKRQLQRCSPLRSV